LREAINGDNRMVLFRVSGTIALKSKLDISSSNITIAGQSAPGGGICLKNSPLIISGDNVVVRFLRIRPGDEARQESDALTIWGADRVMVDHCSLSWSTDSVNDVVRDSTNVTVQWCIISEPLNESVHSKGAHGYGTGWGSGPRAGNSFHHNLLAHCNSRSPRLGSEKGALLDVRNNVIYNLGSGWAYGGEHARVNYVGNYYRPGPNTRRPHEIFRISSPKTRMFLADNFVEGDRKVTARNALGLAADDDLSLGMTETLVTKPFTVPTVYTHTAEQAYTLVLDHAGASLPARDAVDERIVADVRNRTGQIINSQNDVGGWPELSMASPPADLDGDGLPDTWELCYQLDPAQAADASAYSESGYTFLEQYLNELASSAFPEGDLQH
jgi:pectate lyase